MLSDKFYPLVNDFAGASKDDVYAFQTEVLGVTFGALFDWARSNKTSKELMPVPLSEAYQELTDFANWLYSYEFYHTCLSYKIFDPDSPKAWLWVLVLYKEK